MELNSHAKVGVVIGNAGVKSLSALPFLLHLQRQFLPNQLTYIGSGAGATLASALSLGFADNEIIDMFKMLYQRKIFLAKFNPKVLLRYLSLIKNPNFSLENALYKKDLLQSLINATFRGACLENLESKVWVHVTNLIHTNGVLAESGRIAELLYATNAVYPILPPMHINKGYYVDGVFSGALPVWELLNKEPFDLLILIGFKPNRRFVSGSFLEHYANVINRTFTIGQRSYTTMFISRYSRRCDISFLAIPFENDISIWNGSKAEEVIKSGEIHFEEEGYKVLEALALASSSMSF